MPEGRVYQSIVQEAAYRRDVQLYKYAYTYTLTAIVAPGGTVPVILSIEQDADFFLEKITGSCYGPCTAAGIVNPANATDFGMPGTAIGFAGRGMSIQITDTGAGRELTNGFVPVELIFTPGYMNGFFQPYRLQLLIRRNSKLRFDIRNRDTQVGANQQIDIALNGYKYTVSEQDILQAQKAGQA
jgi:hypothetical protein